MKKVDFPEFHNPKLDEIRLKKFVEVKEDPLFKEFILENELTDEEIMNNLSVFLRTKEDLSFCKDCKGVCHKYPSKTQFKMVLHEGSRALDLELKTCSFYEEIEYLKELFYHLDFPSSWLQYDFKEEILKNDYTSIRANVIKNLRPCLDKNQKKGLYIYGESRIGKSFILALFSKYYLQMNGGNIAFCSSNELFKDLNDLYFNDKESFAREMMNLQNVDILILDGFGREHKSDFMRDMYLLPLLNERRSFGKITFFTSNFTLKEIFTMYQVNKASLPQVKQLELVLNDLATPIEMKGHPYSF